MTDAEFEHLLRKVIGSIKQGKAIDPETKEFLDQYIRHSKGIRTAFDRWMSTRV